MSRELHIYILFYLNLSRNFIYVVNFSIYAILKLGLVSKSKKDHIL